MSEGNVPLCPNDNKPCIMTEEDKCGMGCWLCPKIQDLRKKYNRKAEGGDEDGGEERK